jgi:hypothetical protein
MLILSKKHVRNGRLNGLKSHDMHVMVQQILHVCVRPFDASYPKACHPCPKAREDFSKAL